MVFVLLLELGVSTPSLVNYDTNTLNKRLEYEYPIHDINFEQMTFECK